MKNKWQQHSIRVFIPTCGQTESKGQTYTNSRPGRSLTHAHSHITRAVAAMDSCFALTGTHRQSISSVGPMNGQSPVSMAATAWLMFLWACKRFWPGHGSLYLCPLLLPVFSVMPFKIDQNKNQNRSIDKVWNLGNERR